MADELHRAAALTALVVLEERFCSRRNVLAAPACSRRACRRLLAWHLPGDPPRAALLRDRLRSRTRLGLSTFADHPADFFIHAALQQPGRLALYFFSRARFGAAALDAGCAELVLLRAVDQYDGQFLVDGIVL